MLHALAYRPSIVARLLLPALSLIRIPAYGKTRRSSAGCPSVTLLAESTIQENLNKNLVNDLYQGAPGVGGGSLWGSIL